MSPLHLLLWLQQVAWAAIFYKRLAALLATKWNDEYCKVRICFYKSQIEKV